MERRSHSYLFSIMWSCCNEVCEELVHGYVGHGCNSSTQEPENFYSQYTVWKTIGHGAYAKVKLACHRLTGTMVAVKVLEKRQMWCFPTISEADIMKMMNHPNIISLFQVIESKTRTYLIMELVEGKQLYEYIQKTGHLQEDDARRIFSQILSATSYFHKCGIIHRDLKPDNIMVDGNGHVTVIDFGLGTKVKHGQKLIFHCGTYEFGAPEQLLHKLYDGPKADVWALGVTLYFMLTGKHPFGDTSSPGLKSKIVEGKYTVPSGLSEELKDLLGLLLTLDPRHRPTAHEVLGHPWLKDTEASQSQEERKVSSVPDRAIVQAMHCIGFKIEDIEESVTKRKFNESMASYYFLKGAMYGETATSDAVGVKRGVLFFSIRENEERSGKNSHTALGNSEKPQWMKKKGGSIYTVLPKMKSDSSKDFTTTSSSKEDFTTSRSQEDSIDLGSESSLLEAETLHSQYAVLKTIGQGAFGKVKLAYHRLTGTQVAIKMIQKKKLWGRPVSSEVDIMMSVNHPNIISLLQVIESQKNAYLIMELVKGHELYDYVKEAGHLEEDNAQGIFRQILNAVGYCHERGIIHRDLKPDNIMVDWKGKVQIIDFGLGTQVKPGEKLSFHCGTYQFYPPEYFLELFYDGLKVDIWALGVVLYFMVVGRLPFDGDTLPVLRNQIVEGKYTVPVGLSEELQDLLGLLLSMDPSFRPTAQEAIAHPWVKDTEVSQSQEEKKITSLPDQVIVQAMHFIGFKTKDIETSVAEKKFNECMASYYFLEGQALQGPSYPTLARPAFPVVAPLPSIEDPFHPPPRRRSSEPALETFFRGRQAGLQGERRATECVIPPYRPLQSTLAVDDRQCKSAPPILENSSRDSTSEITIENSNTDSTSEEVKSTTEEENWTCDTQKFQENNFTLNTTKSLSVLEGTSSKVPEGVKMQILSVDFGSFWIQQHFEKD
ncbi:hypothetical protein STEG23_006084, partial [Scotinomys teguina]